MLRLTAGQRVGCLRCTRLGLHSMIAITSRHNASVARYLAAARGADRSVVLLDGLHLVCEALAAGTPVQHALVAADARQSPDVRDLVRLLLDRHVTVASASAAVMSAVSPVRSKSSVVALARRPESGPRVFARRTRPVVIACDVQDPGNVGAIVRVAEAGGASGVVAAGSCADPFGWKALRGSMGSALRLPLLIALQADAAVALARRHRRRIVATVPRGGRSLCEVDLAGSFAVLIGGEGHGLHQALIADADERISVPMEPPVESLNGAVTAALVVYEARRQRDRT